MKFDVNSKAYKIQTAAMALTIPVLVIIYWYISSANGTLNTRVLPTPAEVSERFISMALDGSLLKNILASMSRVIKGYLIGASLGFVIGMLNGLFQNVHRFLLLLISVLRPIPPISLIPLFILWLGIGEASKVAIIVIGSFWPVLLNTMQGVQDTDPKLLEVADSFGKNKWSVFFHVILPSSLPSVFTGLRLGVSHSWTAVVTAEMIGASAGVGYLIQYARELVQPDLLLLGIITIGIVGLLIDVVVIFLQKKLIYWRVEE